MVTSRKHSAAEHTGTQSIERALRILRELAARGEFGWRLSDLAASGARGIGPGASSRTFLSDPQT